MISGIGFEHTKFKFPCGETQITITEKFGIDAYDVIFKWNKDESEIIELLLLCDALRRTGKPLRRLHMTYVPYGRQDRVPHKGAFSLKVFCDLINSLGFQWVSILDPHSDVTPALINNCQVIEQWGVALKELAGKKDYYLVAPDAGATKKIRKLAIHSSPLDIIYFTKNRDPETGNITSTSIAGGAPFSDKDCYIVDDICDGGKTFVEIAKTLRQWDVSKIILIVTHGFFTKGLEVFDGLIDEIYTSEGKVK